MTLPRERIGGLRTRSRFAERATGRAHRRAHRRPMSSVGLPGSVDAFSSSSPQPYPVWCSRPGRDCAYSGQRDGEALHPVPGETGIWAVCRAPSAARLEWTLRNTPRRGRSRRPRCDSAAVERLSLPRGVQARSNTRPPGVEGPQGGDADSRYTLSSPLRPGR